jgi:Kef-type K+ transport system membrane component KefB
MRRCTLTRGTTALIFVALLLSALATEFIGIHAIFGAFLLGAVIPLKIISPTLFAMMVLMALATTIATTPLLQVLGVGAGDGRCRETGWKRDLAR